MADLGGRYRSAQPRGSIGVVIGRLGLLLLVLVAVACGDDGPSLVEQGGLRRYSVVELDAGVPVEVDDPSGVVTGAEVFLPEGLPGYVALHPRLDRGEVVVLDDEGGYDRVIVYRTGPYCGLLPEIVVRDTDERIEIDIRSVQAGDCEATEYDEAVGLSLAIDYASRPIAVTHR